MIQTIKADERHFSDFGWLKTYWLFSFDTYYDPANVQFGALRVFNDDVVAAQSGFPTHGHREMEIVTIVLRGEVTHKDSMGNHTTIGAGEVQRMSAGTGITHSEYNLKDEPVHFYQIWILPGERRLQPSYDQKRFGTEARRNRLLAVASGQTADGAVTMHTDATIYMADFDAGQASDYELAEGRGAFIYVTEGRLQVNGTQLAAKEQARITGERRLQLSADDQASFIFIDVPLR
ncbi:MAG TPA: pirin family protein [Blastocatellia bacterium]|nr:pirin family protein [Blastocatellia bacterium]